MSAKLNYRSHNWLAFKINRDVVLNNLNVFKKIVCDLGCGEKPYKKIIEQHCEKYVGIDWANTFHKHQFDVVADLNKDLPLDNNIADTVVSFQVMEHLCEPQVFLNEAFRILKPGGFILITVPFQWHIHEAPFDYYRYTNFGLEFMFKKTGFSEIKVKANTGFWSTSVLKFNYHSLRWIRGPKVIKKTIRTLLVCIWYFNQKIAPVLDKIDKNENETGSYTVIARKL